MKNGKKAKKLSTKKNRSGNPMSISLFQAYEVITEEYGVSVNKAVCENIMALTEIRDNSIHFVNDDLFLSVKVQQLGSANLQNYLNLVSEWFGDMLSDYNFYLMPISFFRTFDKAPCVILNSNEKNVLNYIKGIEKQYDDMDISDYNLTLNIDFNVQKVKSDASVPVHYSNDENALPVILREEDVISKYPWDYNVLTKKLGDRYTNFKQNHTYHKIRRSLERVKKFTHIRFMDPRNKQGGNKKLYNPNILKEFDKHYTKR